MRYVEAGGARVSAVGLGTWQFGSSEWGYGDNYARHDAIDIVHRALELGINLIDTAEMYGFGKSERIVGQAIEGHRDEVFLATKVLPIVPVRAVVAQRRGPAPSGSTWTRSTSTSCTGRIPPCPSRSRWRPCAISSTGASSATSA